MRYFHVFGPDGIVGAMCSNGRVHVLAVVVSVLPLALLSAVSPMIFVNATTIQLAAGMRATLRYVLGNAAIVVLISVVGAGLLGAAFTSFVEREVVSAGVDFALAAVLLAYGVHQWRQRGPQQVHPVTATSAMSRGVVTMSTNFTSIPLILAASQHLGASSWPVWLVLPALVATMAVTLTPAWLPLVLAVALPHVLETVQARQDHAPHNGLGNKVAALLPVGTCLLGAAFLTVHAVTHLAH